MLKIILCVTLLVQGYCSVPLQKDAPHPDVGLNTIELIEKYGYPVEAHENIKTEDGYLLDMHRIPHGKDNAEIENRPVVLLMHGVLSSSADWVNMGPSNGFGFVLADRGYDVWMGNCRGNTWSRKHVSLNPDWNHEFWNYSWNEIGIYDLPALIDHILKVTGQESIYYIGHSQGTTISYVLTAERPEYNKKLRLITSMAPIGYINNINNPFFKLLATMEGMIDWWTTWLGMWEFSPHSDLYPLIGQLMCNDEAITQVMCQNIIFMIAGFDSDRLNKTMIPVIMSNTPAGVATRQLIHYSQEMNSGKFRKFDHGMAWNWIYYGSYFPPNYNLNKITAPIAFFYSENDMLASVKDVERFYIQLNSAIYKYKIPYNKFNHLDFLWAMGVVEEVYDPIIKKMQEF